MGMGFQFEQHSLGLWDLSWDLKKTISWEMGLGPPLHDPLKNVSPLVSQETFFNYFPLTVFRLKHNPVIDDLFNHS